MRGLALTGVVALALAAAAAAARGGATPAPRLQGAWNVSGRYVLAQNLNDRRVGDAFREGWTLTPRCRRGPCDVVLRRAGRATLLRREGRTWRGIERFSGRFFCGGRVFERGTDYVAEWRVTVTRWARRSGRLVATRFQGVGGTVGRSRAGLPCAQVISREGVTFTGAPAAR